VIHQSDALPVSHRAKYKYNAILSYTPYEA